MELREVLSVRTCNVLRRSLDITDLAGLAAFWNGHEYPLGLLSSYRNCGAVALNEISVFVDKYILQARNSCGGCKFVSVSNGGTHFCCHRYPQSVAVTKFYWCGEYEAVKE